MDYWIECISEALDEAGITATDDQICLVALWAEGAHDQYSMAYGHDCIPNPVKLENEKLKKELKIEQEKILCKECNGLGRIITYGPVHSADTECSKCRGEGRHTR